MMSFSLAYITIILALLSLCLSYMYLSWNFFKIPANKYFIGRPLPLIGNIIDIVRNVRKFGFPDLFTHMKKKHGSIYGFTIFSDVQLTVHNSEILRHILFTDFHNFPNRRNAPMSGLLDLSVLRVKGLTWRKQRKLLSPAFSSGKLKEISPSINVCASKTAQRIINFANSNDSFEMKGITGGFTMDVIASSQFGLDIDAQNSDDNLFIKHAEGIIFRGFTIKSALMNFTPWLCTLIGKIKGKEMTHASHDDAHAFFKKTINKILSMNDDSKDIRPNIISILKNSQCDDNSADNLNSKLELSEEEMISNAALFIVAGYDTTANTLSFLFYFLAVYSEVQDKVLQEIKSVFGDDLHISYEGLANLKYLDMCINETLRIYPIASATSRVALKDCKYKDVEIRKNWIINIPIKAIHMDPELWPDPEKFDPERFSQDYKGHRDATSFIPFGAGPRSCIGIRLAFLEMKILVVELLRQIKFIKCEKTEIPLKLNKGLGLLSPLNGIWLKAKLRENNVGQI